MTILSQIVKENDQIKVIITTDGMLFFFRNMNGILFFILQLFVDCKVLFELLN